MEKSLRGRKHVCSNCNTKFFDFNKEKIICPNCKTELVIKKKISNISDNLKTKDEDKKINHDIDLSEEVTFDDADDDDKLNEVIQDEAGLKKE